MPEINPESIDWDDRNASHATRHGVSLSEIEQVIENSPVYRRNKKGRQADFLAFGYTDGGRRVVVAVSWDATRRVIRPITAWGV